MKKNNNYKWVKHIIKEVSELEDGKTDVTQYVVIGRQDLRFDLFLVSPFTDFILNLPHNKTTTQVAYANTVVPFLNYVYEHPDFEIDKLTVQDGIDFLNSLNVTPYTKYLYSCRLEEFYVYLQEKGIISFNEHTPLFKGKYKNIIKSNKKEVIHNLKTEYIPLFINTAIEVVPEIALGVYLQCFGGLRSSEVTSIEYENISLKCDSAGIRTMVINLTDKDLRPDTEYGFIAKNKKNRKQEIIPAFGDLLYTLYEVHKEKYKQETTDAVFIDEKGLPMTNYTYANKFAKLKKAFIQKLEEAEDFEAQAYALYLRSYKWKTHICRGIFSNQVANATNSIGEIALWRGDSSMTSALTYLNNKEEVGKDVEKILDELYKGGYSLWQ